jgi:hypothetical protein
MLWNAVVLTVVLLHAGSPAATEAKQNAGNTAEIKGTLIEEKTDKPLKGVQLTLMGYGGIENGKVVFIAIEVNGQFPPKPVTTDQEGRFVFSKLKEGAYVVLRVVGGIMQGDSVLTIKQGALSTPGIQVKSGESLDLGKVSVSQRK